MGESTGTGPVPEQQRPGAAPAPGTDRGGVLPEQTRDDTDAGWGQGPGDDDEWLYAQRPPHWE